MVLEVRTANGSPHGPVVVKVLLEDGRVLWPLFPGEVKHPPPEKVA